VERDHQLAVSGMRFEPLLRSQISRFLAQRLMCLIGNLRPQDPTLLKWLARDERSRFFRILACLQHHRQFGTHCNADQQLEGKLRDFAVPTWVWPLHLMWRAICSARSLRSAWTVRVSVLAVIVYSL
jgi:hypothetical protein